MLARCLLFSSRQETANPLIQALEEMEVSVQYCPEIFAAIKELTSRGYEVIATDLDDGPEAEFLMKTARDLRLNRNAFIFAAARERGPAPQPHPRADLVLAKPLIPEQVKYSLLMCDRFITCMRDWIAEPEASTRKTAPGMSTPAVSRVLTSQNSRNTPLPN